jgi:hypothetical protein
VLFSNHAKWWYIKLWTETSLKPWIEKLLSNHGIWRDPPTVDRELLSNLGYRSYSPATESEYALKLRRELLLSHFG